MSVYRSEERHLFDPGPCPKCGGTNSRVNWVDVHESHEEPDSVFIPGTVQCLNPECPWGPAGTTPSGETGEVWVSKLPTE